MPKLFEYLGIIFSVFSKEHLPVHFHVSYQDFQMIVIFHFKNGKSSFEWKERPGFKPLPPAQLKKAKAFVKKYFSQLYFKWNAHVILDKKVKFEKIVKL